MSGLEINGLLGILVLILNVYAIIQIIQAPTTTAAKVGWIVVILLLPVIGFIAWFLFAAKPNAGHG